MRVRKARPLLIAVGAAVALSACGDNTTTPDQGAGGCDLGVCVTRDLSVPAVYDLGLRPARD